VCGAPQVWRPLFSRTCWTCLNPALITGILYSDLLDASNYIQTLKQGPCLTGPPSVTCHSQSHTFIWTELTAPRRLPFGVFNTSHLLFTSCNSFYLYSWGWKPESSLDVWNDRVLDPIPACKLWTGWGTTFAFEFTSQYTASKHPLDIDHRYPLKVKWHIVRDAVSGKTTAFLWLFKITIAVLVSRRIRISSTKAL
jgi:hypothetical protein